MIVSGGLRTAERARLAYAESGADAVMIARGSLGNPWIFAELTGGRAARPDRCAEIETELRWMLDRAEEHWGARSRGAQPAQVLPAGTFERLGFEGPDADRFQRTESLDEVRELLLAGPRAASGGRVSAAL